MSHSTAGFLGVTRQVPTCVLGSGQPAHRAAPQAHPPVRTCQHSQSHTHRRRQALNSWILHAVRSDQQTTKVDNSVLQLISDLTNKVDTEHAAILAENARGLEGMVDTSSEGLKQKVQQSIQKLQKGLLERETEVRMHVPVIGVKISMALSMVYNTICCSKQTALLGIACVMILLNFGIVLVTIQCNYVHLHV